MTDETKKDGGGKGAVAPEVAAAIAAAVALHRAGPGSVAGLFEGGLADEGAWGRSARAGMGAAVAFGARRD